MTTDEIDIRPRRRRTTREKLESIGHEYSDRQTMQLTPEHLKMLSQLANEGTLPLEDFAVSEAAPLSIHDTQPTLIDADPDDTV